MSPEARPEVHDAMRWPGDCYGCGRERQLQTRIDHASQALCDECAAKPYARPSGAGLAIDLDAERAARREAGPFALLGFDELLTLPDPNWLIKGLIPEGLTVAYGSAGTYKSFIAGSMAMSVAAGIPWYGHPTGPGYVVYVAAEGRAGLKARARAWWQASGRPDMSRMRWLPEAVNLRDRAQAQRVRDALAALPEAPRLLVVDTMARSMPGGDENSTKDVGEFITAVDGLCPTRMVVHHTGHDPSRERGSSALRGAADLMLKIQRDGKSPRVSLVCDKLKDAPEWDPIALRAEPSHGSLTFAVIVEKEEARDDLRDRVLAYVTEHAPVAKRRVREGVTGRNPEIDAALVALEREGLTRQTPEGWTACPEAPGTLGHAPPQAEGGGVPRQGATPVGGARLGTPHALPCPEPCPTSTTDEDQLIAHLIETFDAEEIGGDVVSLPTFADGNATPTGEDRCSSPAPFLDVGAGPSSNPPTTTEKEQP